MKIIFFGTAPIAAHILSYLYEKDVKVLAVVTRPDRPRGRTLQLQPSAVKETSLRLHREIPIFQPEKASIEEFAQLLQTFEPDLFVVAAYGEIIKTNLLSIPKKGCINVHVSLLPKYRGAAPIQRCLMAGEKETGVTIIDMVLQMDAGDMLGIARCPIPEEMNAGELEEKLRTLACPLLLETIHKIDAGTAPKIPQNHAEATLAPKILPEDRKIDWTRSAEELHNQIRALAPSPGAYCIAQGKQMQIKRAKVVHGLSGKPGETLSYGAEWIVACGTGALALLEVQLEGKKALPVNEFTRGHPHTLTLSKP